MIDVRLKSTLGIPVGALLMFAIADLSGARAANSGEADRDLLLGAIATYETESDARSACGEDLVVWADRYDGYYYLPREQQFGATPAGAYACKRGAVKGNYWDTDPLSSMSGQPGREFPYRPLYVGS